MAKVRKDGWYDERTKEGKKKNRQIRETQEEYLKIMLFVGCIALLICSIGMILDYYDII